MGSWGVNHLASTLALTSRQWNEEEFRWHLGHSHGVPSIPTHCNSRYLVLEGDWGLRYGRNAALYLPGLALQLRVNRAQNEY